jgi:hypothetical protein
MHYEDIVHEEFKLSYILDVGFSINFVKVIVRVCLSSSMSKLWILSSFC